VKRPVVWFEIAAFVSLALACDALSADGGSRASQPERPGAAEEGGPGPVSARESGSDPLPPDEGVHICTDSYKDRITHRLLLWDGRALVASRELDGWRVALVPRLTDESRRQVTRAYRQRDFFRFPARSESDELDGRTRELWAATAERAHRSFNREAPRPDYDAVFAECEAAFAGIELRPSQRVEQEIHRPVQLWASSLGEQDQRRRLLLEWLEEIRER
jgi:hypothetical protein